MKKVILVTLAIATCGFFAFGLFLYKIGEDRAKMFRCGTSRDY